MRYQIIDVYQTSNINHYIAKCLKKHSPQFVVIESPRTLCLGLDIIIVNQNHTTATWATGEEITLKILNQFETFDKAYMSRH